MLTVFGTFGDYNIIKCDDGSEIKAYPYGIDYPKVYQRTGYFLLLPHEENDGGYTIINFVIVDSPLNI